MSPPITVRAALYARTSTDDKGQDPELQLVELRRLAEHRRWSVAGEYVDAGVSGSKDRRPALDRLMADAQAGKLDAVAVWRFDRFARSTQHLLAALEQFRAINVDFVSMRESIDTSTPMGRMVFTMVAAVAELEREIIRERVIAGVRKAQASGKHVGRPRKHLDVGVARLLLDQGLGQREVARKLGTTRGVLVRRLAEAGGGRAGA